MRIAIFFFLLFASPSALLPARAADCLILYDSTGQYGWIGQLHAQMLANLLGHFPLSAELKPVEQYSAGDLNSAQAVFYLGTVYDNPIPRAFLLDVMNTPRPVCWFRYNLWQLSGSLEFRAQFRSKFGFRFDALDSSGYTNILFKNETFSKDILDPELGRALIVNSNLAQAVAVASKSNPSNAVPYVVHASNFWYVADAPFSYISEEDRYLVFADLLHDIVAIPHAESHRALIRLEDINATDDPQVLREAADFLASEGVPFALAVIPVYLDPLGTYNNGARIALSEAPEFIQALQYMASKGGQILMHGYTHQYDSVLNPFSGVTAEDFEFFRETVDADYNVLEYSPVPEDSRAWAQGRLEAGLAELQKAGFTPVGWETPHYTASALDYSVFAGTFSLTMQRVLYSDSQGNYAGQFFPYPIQRDVYSQKIMPENLGNIDPASWNGYPPRLPEDLLRAARKNSVLRDAWAGAYFHPWLDLDYLTNLVRGIKGLGYTYVPLVDATPPVILKQPQSVTASSTKPVSFSVTPAGAAPLRYQWQCSGTDIPGATNASLLFTNGQFAPPGAYSVTISNSAGHLTSLPANLTHLALTNRLNNGAIQLSFQTESGHSYLLESSTNLTTPLWHTITNIGGNGAVVQIEESLGSDRTCFYRLRLE